MAATRIGIVGLGYVGLPLAVAFAEAGQEVVGLDSDRRKVEGVNAGRSHVEDVPDATLAAHAGLLRATADPSDLAACEAVIVCVSPRTIEVYRANVMTKMQANSLSELVRLAMRAGMLND